LLGREDEASGGLVYPLAHCAGESARPNRIEEATMSVEDDIREVRRVHDQWYTANHGLDIPKMRECFAPDYLMFNLNGHPYFGLDEKVKLWEHYKGEIAVTAPPHAWDIRTTVDGDMAYVTCEGNLPIRVVGAEGTGASNLPAGSDVINFKFRSTTVLRRDDGRGNKVWKIWHFHCSPLAPDDEPRPAFGDTVAERGERGETAVYDNT
jgi:ketosteroid isomerase-like protein